MASLEFGRRLVESTWFTVELHAPTVNVEDPKNRRIEGEKQETACRVPGGSSTAGWPRQPSA
jgi:hypothetical protein